MNSNRPSQPPEEPQYQSEPATLSPASPKPIHFPAPTTIPLLELQMDVDHNQVERHMADPAMHNTEVRPDFWRDPNETQQGQQQGQGQQQQQEASPYSTGGEATDAHLQQEDNTTIPTTERTEAEGVQDSKADTTTAHDASNPQPEPVHLSNQASHQANAQASEAQAQAEPQAATSTGDVLPASSDANVHAPNQTAQVSEPTVKPDDFATQTDEVKFDQQAQPTQGAPSYGSGGNGGVDVDSILATLQAPPTINSTPNGVNPQYAPSNAHPEAQPPPPGTEGTPTAAATLSGLAAGAASAGLPARPPPQEQPLIHPNYVHSQHIRDYHPHATNPAFQPQQQQNGRASSQGHASESGARGYVPPVVPGTFDGSNAINGQNGTTAAAAATGYATGAPPGYAGSGTGFAQAAGSPAAGQQPQSSQQQQFYGGGGVFGIQHQAHDTSATPSTTTNLAAALEQQQQAQNQNNAYPTSAQAYRAGLTQANTPIESRRESKLAAGQIPNPEDRPWDATVQAKYDRFIEAERGYVSEGRWEQFPPGSRLFVGNLSSEKVTKRDIFHVFHPYGELAQVSIKQAYGFVQFLRAEDCTRALHGEQGVKIREKKVHLEVSKPQRNKNQSQPRQHQEPQRRSRSPDYGRGSRPGAGVDRYTGGRSSGRSQPAYGRQGGYRSPSPPRYGSRGGYDDRGYRQRSPPDYGRGLRYRSPSPRRSEDDDLPLPRRQPRDVPDVQILVLDQLDRDFIAWVEKAFSNRGVRVDVLILSPRLSEDAVIRRQILEGVTAVSKLTRMNQDTGRIGLRIFDRRAGVGNVQFEEYDNLDPSICAELVLRAKNSYAQAPPTPTYGTYSGSAYGAPAPAPPPPQQYGAGVYAAQPSYAQPPSGYPPQQGPYSQPPRPPTQPQQAPPTPAGAPPNLQNMISSLDPNGLQNLLSVMNQGQAPVTPQSAGGAFGAPVGQPQPPPPQQQVPAQGQVQGGGQVNMQDILARLGTYGR